ncbi:MAG: dihydroorotate dehydrogenase electron transfer subunit [Candidatus Bathyarchaeum sp.]|nr:MAG: dihydroorotate dehydrogenase electron transfer subunit [Candidatus Bathyarchaeum sp.]
MRIVEIMDVRRESANVKAFTFKDRLCGRAEAGQFVMVWIPGVDEIPMSLSTITADGLSSITVAEVGEATKALNQRKPGDTMGIRGPFGKGFTPTEGNVMIVGGGTGVGPLVPLTEKLAETAAKVTLLVGAKTKDELLFLDRLEKALSNVNSEIVFTTDDGSYGLGGLVTDQAEQKLMKETFDMIYTCGPEQMIYKMFLLAEQHQAPLQASLERVMRCAIGICGSCGIGNLMVCKDGPVLTSEQLRSVKEDFGRFQLDLSGRKIKL